MLTKNYTFDDPIKYNYDSDKIELSAGKAKLKLQQADVDFTEDFDNDTGFVYDSNKAEFSGGKVQQKDTRPAGATFYASYNNNINGNWGNGILTGTGYNGAGITGNKLDLSGGANKYIDYDADLNADSQQTGCIRFKFTPKYSGAPANPQYMIELTQAAGSGNNRIRIYHSGGLLFLAISNNAGGSIVSVAEAFVPVADTEYEIELNWDITTGATRLFIDGVQLGLTQAGTGTRDVNIGLLRSGKDMNGNGNADFLIDDLLIFSIVQHTSNYTPNWSNIYENIYNETSVILPEMEHVGDGSINLFNSFATTETGTPKYTLQIGRSGNYLYWNGLAWVLSDGTYSQANDETTFNTNCGSLPVDGEKYGQFKIIFPDSSTQSSVSELTANMNVDNGYVTTNPCIITLEEFYTDKIYDFIETSSFSGNDNIKYNLKKGSKWYYYNGLTWTESNGTYSQSNTENEIENNKGTFTDEAIRTALKIFLHSGNGSTSPELSNVKINYDFAGIQHESIHLTEFWFDIFQTDSNAGEKIITLELAREAVKYKTRTVIEKEIYTLTINDSGRVTKKIADTENMEEFNDGIEMYYILKIGNKIYYINIPEQEDVNLFDSGVIVSESEI